MRIAGVSAVVSGGARGLGAAAARMLAEKGARVAIFDLNEADGETLAKDIGGVFCNVDVGNSDSVRQGFELARREHGQERILVNCAGIGIVHKTAARSRRTGGIKSFPLADFETVLRVNLLGTYYCAVAATAGMLELPPLEDDERGVVINTSSIAALEGEVGQTAYSASKAGVLGLTLPMARDFKDEGIRVNVILPGSFDTPLLSTAKPDVYRRLVASVPFPKRLGRPDEFGRLVIEMCENTYLNGESVRLDGASRL
jgi:NAD(P)-dependent dehydrogenase (short-subunit alcohol dehydrogenase family)